VQLRAPKILLTGPPGCGKTTAMRRLAGKLAGIARASGFFTNELREGGQRVGFEIQGLHGARAVLAHVHSASPVRVGKYGVEVANLERILQEELLAYGDAAQLFLVDEIGKMECASQLFVDTMRKLLGDPRPMVATIALKGRGFIEEAKGYPGVELVVVSPANRDQLPEELAGYLRQLIESPRG